MISLFFIPILLLLILLVLILVLKKKLVCACILTLLFVITNLYTQSIPLSSLQKHLDFQSNQTIRLISYNVNAKCGNYKNLQNWREIVHFIDSISPDVILPQEYSFYGGDSLRMALNARYPYNSKFFFGYGYYMTDMVFSRYPIIKLDYLLGFGKTIYVIDVNVDGKVVKVVNCHLHSNNFTSEVERGKHNFLRKLKEGYNERAKEVDDIVDLLKSYTNDPLIVCGDMNDVSGSYTIRTLQDNLSLKDAWWQGGTGFGFTYHGYGVMRFRLDHILYNKYLELQNVSVPHVGFSDHWPVVADFLFNDFADFDK